MKRSLPLHLIENTESKCFVYRHPNYRRRKSVVFSYAHGKDRELARAAAAKFTLRRNEELGPPPPTSPEGRMTVQNRSGVVGVDPGKRFIRRPSGREYTYYHWRASWVGCPNTGGVTWQCGPEENTARDDVAYALAMLTRRFRARILEELRSAREGGKYRRIIARKPAPARELMEEK